MLFVWCLCRAGLSRAGLSVQLGEQDHLMITHGAVEKRFGVIRVEKGHATGEAELWESDVKRQQELTLLKTEWPGFGKMVAGKEEPYTPQVAAPSLVCKNQCSFPSSILPAIKQGVFSSGLPPMFQHSASSKNSKQALSLVMSVDILLWHKYQSLKGQACA